MYLGRNGLTGVTRLCIMYIGESPTKISTELDCGGTGIRLEILQSENLNYYYSTFVLEDLENEKKKMKEIQTDSGII